MKRLILLLLVAGSVGAQNADQVKTDSLSTGPILSINDFPQPWIVIGGDAILDIESRENHKPLVHIALDGKVTYGEAYKPDDAAKLFWQTLGEDYPEICTNYQEHLKAKKDRENR